MPVYNAEGFLAAALDSILAQSWNNIELIAVDDGSTDDSLAILHKCRARDRRVHVVSRPNTGIVGALNDGLALCRGEYIARMDADDLVHPRRLELQVKLMEKTPHLVAVGTAVEMIDVAGHRLWIDRPQLTHERIEAELLLGNGLAIIHATAMMRREALTRIGGYREHARNIHEDLDLFLRLACIGRLANMRKPLYRYRRLSTGNVTNHLQSTRADQAKRDILTEAHFARGITQPGDPVEGWRQANPAMYWHWRVWRQLKSGKQFDALGSSIRALSYRPLWEPNWRALLCSLRGR